MPDLSALSDDELISKLPDSALMEVVRKRQGGQQPQAPQLSEKEQFIRSKMQETENSPLGAFTSGGRSVMTFGLSDLLAKQFGLNAPESGWRTAGQAATIAGSVGPPIARAGMSVARGIPYMNLFNGGKRFATALEKSPAMVTLTDEADTLARIRVGVNKAVRPQVLSKAEQVHGNLTGTNPVEDLLNAGGRVPVAKAHDVANLTDQSLAKSWFGDPRGMNDLKELGLKASINRKIKEAAPELAQLYKDYGKGQSVSKFISMLNPFGIPLKLLSNIKKFR